MNMRSEGMLTGIKTNKKGIRQHIDKKSTCNGYCPECGSALFFSRLGCICRDNHEYSCTWNCESCNPRCGATR